MPKVYLPLSVVCLLGSFLLLPVVRAGKNGSTVSAEHSIHNEKTLRANTTSLSNILYDSLKLQKFGLSREAMLYAFRGLKTLEQKGKLNHSGILTVCDFSQPSNRKRMYIIDTRNFRLLMNTYVAHGKNSGLSYAERFSNKLKSLQSSLGFYVTRGTYFGKHGLSLKLSGEDKGFNDNAEDRAVVVHGANYIGDQRLGRGYMGRSFGCPAVPQSQVGKVISYIKEGSCLFIYHPTQKYLRGSKILNG